MHTHIHSSHKYPFTHNMYTFLLWHTAPASSLCTQLWITHPLKRHWSRVNSEPAQATSSIQMVPVPWPNSAKEEALTAPLNPSCLHTTWVQLQKAMHMCCTVPSHQYLAIICVIHHSLLYHPFYSLPCSLSIFLLINLPHAHPHLQWHH